MRVLSIGSVYPPHLLGGYEVIWQGVTRQLVADGHHSTVLVTDFVNPDVPSDAPEDAGIRRELSWYWRDHTWPRFSWRERLALERHNATVFDRAVTDVEPDVVAFWPMGGMSLSLITRTHLPTVFFLLDPWPVYGPRQDPWLATWSGFKRPLAYPGQRLFGLPTTLDLSRGRWVACSSWMLEHGGVKAPARCCTVLTPGVEARFLEAGVVPAAPWSWRMLYLGRVVEQKGVLTAVEALVTLPADATLTIVSSGGDDGYRAALVARAEELGVADRVLWRSQVDRDGVVAAYAAADVVLHPVRWDEPWGLVPLEAMAVGRPVVATGTGGSADFLRDGENALLHPPGDAAALAAAVSRLAGDAGLRSRLVTAGRSTAESHSAEAFNRAAVDELIGAAAASTHTARR